MSGPPPREARTTTVRGAGGPCLGSPIPRAVHQHEVGRFVLIERKPFFRFIRQAADLIGLELLIRWIKHQRCHDHENPGDLCITSAAGPDLGFAGKWMCKRQVRLPFFIAIGERSVIPVSQSTRISRVGMKLQLRPSFGFVDAPPKLAVRTLERRPWLRLVRAPQARLGCAAKTGPPHAPVNVSLRLSARIS